MYEPSDLYLWCARLNVLMGALAMLFSGKRPASACWILAGLFWTIQCAAFFRSAGLTSLSGIAPTFGIAALVLCLSQGSHLNRDLASGRLRPRFSAFFLLLLGLGSLVPEARSHDSFMMGYLFATLFFLSRPLGLGLTLFALAGTADSLVSGGRSGSRFLAESRQTAFSGAILFLAGEIAGCYWGFAGWGTTWRWSGNFFFSAMIFVLFMACLHLPRSVFASVRARALAFGFPLTMIALAMTLSKVMP